MAKQYDLSEEAYQRLLKNAKRRAELRHEFLKNTTDPKRFTGGGALFDSAIARYSAMRVNSFEHFKANAKTSRFGILFVVLPIAIFSYIVKRDRDGIEEKLRSGQVAYADRSFKFA